MAKALLGFIVGALLASGLCLALEARRQGVAERSATPAAAPGQAPDGEESRLQAALATAQSSMRELAIELRAERARGSLPEPSARPAAGWRADLARRIAGAHDREWLWDYQDERAQALMFDLLTLVRDEAAREGVTPAEAAAGPGGTAALALELLRAAEPPPDAATLARLQEALQAGRKDWEEYLGKRERLTMLERRAELDRMSGAVEAVAADALGRDQHDRWIDAEELWEQSFQGEDVSYTGISVQSEDRAKEAVSEHWSSALRLDAEQKVALRPVVDEYVREVADLMVEARARNSYPAHAALLERAIRAQKRIAETLGLNSAQAQALAEMSEVFVPSIPRPR